MTEEQEPECQLRRRRSSGNRNLPLNLEVGFQVNEGGPSQGTPSPGCYKRVNSKESPSSALLEFRKKQQSFDVTEIHIEECEEEEILLDSDDEGEVDAPMSADRPITPTPIQDFAARVVYTEGPQSSDFLRVKAIETECITDVSDADTDGEE